jgi:uncharacterized membrane protein YebE (DUF533 family)
MNPQLFHSERQTKSFMQKDKEADTHQAESRCNQGHVAVQTSKSKRRKAFNFIAALTISLAIIGAMIGLAYWKYKQSQSNAHHNELFEDNHKFPFGLASAFIKDKRIGAYELAPGNGSGVSGIHVGLMVGTGKVVFIER